MTDKLDKPNRQENQKDSSLLGELVPAAAKLAAEGFQIPMVGTAIDLVQGWAKSRAEKAREAVDRQTSERLEAFYKELLAGDISMEEKVARAFVDSRDFLAVHQAVLNELEGEKTGAYATLARGLATGTIASQWRRHFVLSLKDLSYAELECLRHAYIAKSKRLVDEGKSYDVEQEKFLATGEPGSLQSIRISNLTSRGFAHEERLSATGELFVKSYTVLDQLTPQSIGARTWSPHKVLLICYQLDMPDMANMILLTENAILSQGIKCSNSVVTRDRLFLLKNTSTLAVLLRHGDSPHLASNMEALKAFTAAVPSFLVDVSTVADNQVASLCEAHIKVAGMPPQQVASKIVEMLVKAMNPVGP